MSHPFDAAALQDIVQAGGVSYKQNGTSYIFDCPKCGKTSKLWMYKKTGYFRCWVCEADGFKGRCEFALSALYGESPSKYSKILRGDSAPLNRFDMEFVDHWGELPAEVDDISLIDWDWPSVNVDWRDPLFTRGAMYLASRGIGISLIRKYDIRYDVRENRVQFPFKVSGQLVGWQGRYCGPTTLPDGTRIPKAHTTLQEGVATRYVMFGDNLVKSPHAVLAEGPIDALKAEKIGGNVASLGKGVQEKQIQFIAQHVKRLYVALDADAGNEITRVAEMARDYKLEPWLIQPPSHREDLGECTPDEVVEAQRRATHLHAGRLVLNIGDKLYF